MVNDNGTLKTTTAVSFPYDNRGLLYGDALFETIKVVHAKVLFWEDHYFRLMASMRILRMPIPKEFTPEYLEDQLLQTINAAGLAGATARIRLTVYRTGDGRYLPQKQGVGFFAFAEALSTPFYTITHEVYEVELYKDHYVNADLLSTLKTTNRAINILGSIYAEENRYASCLLLNQHKHIVEGLHGNLFLVKGNHIKTPRLEDGCLRGVIRKQLLGILPLMKEYTFEEAVISPFELQKADELFLTNAIMGIQPITKYRKKTFETRVAQAILQKLNVKARLG